MKNFITKNLIVLLAIWYCILPSFAFELDMSVDEEIKKKYNTSQIEYDLPKLPQTKNQPSTNNVPKTTPVYTTSAPTITPVDKKDGIKIPKWTKFQTKSNQTISDWAQRGTNVSFTTTSPVTKRYITIPAGTKFNGVIVNSHRPQKTGNGGLVVLKITSMTYNGKTYAINGKITKANYKKIFLNNIKGKRGYWQGVGKQVDRGEAFYKKAKNVSSKMSDNPLFIILSPIPTIIGAAGCTVCTIISPLTGLTAKGGNLSIPSGSEFEIKLLDDAYIK